MFGAQGSGSRGAGAGRGSSLHLRTPLQLQTPLQPAPPRPPPAFPARGAAWLPPPLAPGAEAEPCAQPCCSAPLRPRAPLIWVPVRAWALGGGRFYSAFLLAAENRVALAPLPTAGSPGSVQGWHRPCHQGNPAALSTQPRFLTQHGANPGFRAAASSSSGCPPADQEAALFEQSFDGCWQELCTCGGAMHCRDPGDIWPGVV